MQFSALTSVIWKEWNPFLSQYLLQLHPCAKESCSKPAGTLSEFLYLWLHQLAPSFLAFLWATTLTTANSHSSESQNHQGCKGHLRSSGPANLSMSVHTDIASDTSLQLRPHLTHYVHIFGVKLASVRNFGSFLASPPCQGAQWATTTSSIFHSLAVQRLPHCFIFPRAARKGLVQHRICHTAWGGKAVGGRQCRETEAAPPDTGSGLFSGLATAAAT